MSTRLRMILLLALPAMACQKAPSLTPAAARALIEAAPAFNEPMAQPSGAIDDGRIKEDSGVKREIVAVFRWRWSGGPFAGQIFRTTVKLHSGGDDWKVYDDVLERELANAMRGQD